MCENSNQKGLPKSAEIIIKYLKCRSDLKLEVDFESYRTIGYGCDRMRYYFVQKTDNFLLQIRLACLYAGKVLPILLALEDFQFIFVPSNLCRWFGVAAGHGDLGVLLFTLFIEKFIDEVFLWLK